MGTKNFLVLRTQFDSINTGFLHEFLYKNMIWILGSVRVFLCNYVLHSFGLILNYIFRFQVGGDRKTESDHFQDSEIVGFREELANFLFQSYEYVFEDGGEKEEEPQGISYMEVVSGVHEDGEKSEAESEISDSTDIQSESDENEGRAGEIESSVLMDTHFDFHEDGRKSEGEAESSVLMEVQPDSSQDGEKGQGEKECSISKEVYSDFHENVEKEGEIESSVLMEVHSDFLASEKKDGETENSVLMGVYENFSEQRKKSEGETECSVLLKVYSDSLASPDSMRVHSDSQENEKEEGETESSVLMEIHSDIHEDENKSEEEKSSDLMEADSAIGTRKYEYVSGRNISGYMEEPTTMSFTFREFYVGPNVPAISDNNAFSSTEIIAQKKESSEEEQVSVQEKEFLGRNTSLEALESENLDAIKEGKTKESGKSEGNDENEGSKQEEQAHREKIENEKKEWKRMLAELECDEELEGDFEWEHDDIVEQLKMELRNARQGGLSTIVEGKEEEEEEDKEKTEETEYPEESEDKKLQKIEEKLEFEDQMDEIQEVYQNYEEKMRKLDILNYQTMHGLGLLQLKEPLKSSLGSMKPIMSHKIWGRREAKRPLMKLVEELERDLELVYVGQVCLSWEILCWQHKKALHLQHSHSHYNIAAGEFQLFQVLLQRFIENEPFQGPRTHNFVKNRCVIRNLLQVPPIRDDSSSMKEKIMVKGDEEENAVCSGRLAEIIKESMWLFWKFVRADKEDGHLLILRTISHQTRSDFKDPSLCDLVKDIKACLHKKERKLKDIVRTGNCLVKKFQKQQQQHEQQLNHEQLLAQVGLKLVSRVLNLSKLRKDHILWCNEKLNRIRFVKKKVIVEPSILFFPC